VGRARVYPCRAAGGAPDAPKRRREEARRRFGRSISTAGGGSPSRSDIGRFSAAWRCSRRCPRNVLSRASGAGRSIG
jgi:hypothetical protein